MNTVITEKLIDDEWIEIDFRFLEKGDVFRLFDDEEKTKPVIAEDGATKFEALGVPYLNQDEVYEVGVKSIFDEEE